MLTFSAQMAQRKPTQVADRVATAWQNKWLSEESGKEGLLRFPSSEQLGRKDAPGGDERRQGPG